ncbi:MAG: hypothetical protein HYX90_03215 [Chloroflexi bacterium]|nr:hypothetical protein [Chloroflexota bacterium]
MTDRLPPACGERAMTVISVPLSQPSLCGRKPSAIGDGESRGPRGAVTVSWMDLSLETPYLLNDNARH